MRRSVFHRTLPLAAVALAAMTGGCGGIQISERVNDGSSPAPASRPSGSQAANGSSSPTSRERGIYVVVDTDVNELRMMDGSVLLWAAPIGTGTDFRLKDHKNEENEWEFSTPRGTMYVQYKEENPVWYLPDWYFVENKRPIPPANSPERRIPNALGVAAVYLGNDIAIHGTDKPELLGQRVSHGCIRLANENALRLFHNVQIGTPVFIVGKPREVVDMPEEPAKKTESKKKEKVENPLLKLTTAELLDRLDADLAAEPGEADWTRTTSVLIDRGLNDDAIALRGVLERAGTARGEARRLEYATFVADAFTRGSLRAVVSLARIDPDAAERAAEDIVSATMAMYHGSLVDAAAPWPSHRKGTYELGPDGSRGWAFLREAENRYRERFGTGPVASRGRR
ncbi:MAG: L,D-transpeptidase family protein [Longimicrobiaceae bacterium]